MTRRRRNNRAAFAAVMAIVLLGLVASTLAAMGMMFAADARRTRAAAAEAQLRQLLIAAAADAQQRLDAGEPVPFDVKVIAPADGAIRLSAATDGDDARQVTVVATIGPRSASQTLRFARDGGRWKLTAVELRS